MSDQMQMGPKKRKRVEDQEGVWLYEYFFSWSFPSIVSIKRVSDKMDYYAN